VKEWIHEMYEKGGENRSRRQNGGRHNRIKETVTASEPNGSGAVFCHETGDEADWTLKRE